MKRLVAYLYFPLTVVYLALSIVYPTDPKTIAARHLTMGEARTIALSLALPLVVVWCFAMYGSWQLKQYGHSIRRYKDGEAITILANGIYVLALYLPVRAVTKIALNYLAHLHPSLITVTNLLITYINVVIPLIAYLLISQAARKLIDQTKIRISQKAIYVLILIFSIVGAVYVNNAASASAKLTPSDWLITIEYGIAVPLRILTIIVPYLFMWSIGFYAAYGIYLYQKNVKGVFYRNSFKLLSIGLIVEIAASFMTQYISAIGTSLRHLPTAVTLMIVYIVLALLAAGFVLIAGGVRKLKQLEIP